METITIFTKENNKHVHVAYTHTHICTHTHAHAHTQETGIKRCLSGLSAFGPWNFKLKLS